MNDHLLKGFPKQKLTSEQEQKLAIRVRNNVRRSEAVNDLMLHNFRDAFFYARRVCRGKITDEELFSIVHGALTRCAERYRPKRQRFFAYAKAFLRGVTFRYWKGVGVVRGAKIVSPMVGESEVESDQFDSWGTVDFDFDQIDAHESAESLKPLIPTLTVAQRLVVVEHYFNHKSFAEIARENGITRAAVQSTHVLVLSKLRARIRERNAIQSL